MPTQIQPRLQALKRSLLCTCVAVFIMIFPDLTYAQPVSPSPSSVNGTKLLPKDSVYSFKWNDDNVSYRKWATPAMGTNPKTLLILHGIGFHSYPYRKITNCFENESLLIYAMDMPGNGLSGKQRGVITSNENTLDAIDSMICIIQKENLNSNTYLLGFSMGGIYALAYAIHDSVAAHLSGLILVGPTIRIHRSQVFTAATPLYVFPLLFNRQKPVVNLDGKRLEKTTSNQEYIQARRNDSLCIHKVSMDYLLKVHEMQKVCKKESLLSRVNVSTLIIYGGKDKISSIKGGDFLCKNMQNCRTERLIYPGCRHSVLWEPDSIKAGRDIANWISLNQK